MNAGGGNVDDLIDAERCRRGKDLEGAADIQVEEIVGVFLAAIFVDAVPGGDVDDAIAAAKHFRQFRPVENGPLDEHRSLLQIQRRTDIRE